MQNSFDLTVEVVPPCGWDASNLLASIDTIKRLSFSGFSVATNPVAKPRMDALSFCRVLMERYGKPATLHITTRDHNRLSLQGLLWGARALGITMVLAMTGDMVPLTEKERTTAVRDISLPRLITMCREAGLRTGVVMNPFTDEARLEASISRLKEKQEAGAQFVVTQPVYTQTDARILADAIDEVGLPATLGILPLRTPKHARFLHEKVGGIEVPDEVRRQMLTANDPISQGASQAKELLNYAKTRFSGACLMPPFDHFDVMDQILTPTTPLPDIVAEPPVTPRPALS